MKDKTYLYDDIFIIPRRDILTRYGRKLLAEGKAKFASISWTNLLNFSKIAENNKLSRYRSIDDEWQTS